MLKRPSSSSAFVRPRRKLATCFQIIGWDGVAFLLNILLLALNLRQHYRYRESPDQYAQVRSEDIHLLTEAEVADLNGTKTKIPAPKTKPKSIAPFNTPKATTPAIPQTLVSPPTTATHPATPTASLPATTPQPVPSTPLPTTVLPTQPRLPATDLPPAKIPNKVLADLPQKVAANPASNSRCAAFGPLTYNRLQQLQKLWKSQNHTPPFTWSTSQPLHHYSVIFPALPTDIMEAKRRNLIEAGFKFHEIWTEGRGHAVIVIGSFEEEAPANDLIQHLHQKGFRESYLMVRTSPTVYWINRTDAVKQWFDQPSIARATGVQWKPMPCQPETPVALPQ